MAYALGRHCTYCVVPGVRGVEQSRSMDAILQECLQLADSGFKEVTLLGQVSFLHIHQILLFIPNFLINCNKIILRTRKNIDAYGRDMTPKRTFADLLNFLNDNLPTNTISRIRYVTSHPRYFSDRVIDAVANLDKVCEW